MSSNSWVAIGCTLAGVLVMFLGIEGCAARSSSKPSPESSVKAKMVTRGVMTAPREAVTKVVANLRDPRRTLVACSEIARGVLKVDATKEMRSGRLMRGVPKICVELADVGFFGACGTHRIPCTRKVQDEGEEEEDDDEHLPPHPAPFVVPEPIVCDERKGQVDLDCFKWCLILNKVPSDASIEEWRAVGDRCEDGCVITCTGDTRDILTILGETPIED